MQQSKIIWTRAVDLADSVLRACAELFSAHYGIWGQSAQPKAGRRVTQSADALKERYLGAPESWAALAYIGNDLIGYAFFQRLPLKAQGYVIWVTQFVVHKEYQNQGLGTRILRSIWSQSNLYAWGLVTANPAAVRALEKATLRRCDSTLINANWAKLQDLVGANLPYIANASKSPRRGTTAVDTDFPLDRTESNATMAALVGRGYDWKLGDIEATEEWAAFTFSEQRHSDEACSLVEGWIADCDSTVIDAYEGMALDCSHKWQAHTKHEIDFFVHLIGAPLSARILDIGCGTGRHSIELASQRFEVVGIDSGSKLIAEATHSATLEVANVQFECGDARQWRSDETFDHAICLYDVIGSFAEPDENAKILETAYLSLKPGGSLLLSVMNGELMDSTAEYRTNKENLTANLLRLAPSKTMQTTGEVFSPRYVLWHQEEGIAYRREQFESEIVAPCELIVRDRRYSAQQIRTLCETAGFDVVDVRYAKIGRWNENHAPTDKGSKEILVHCRKPSAPE